MKSERSLSAKASLKSRMLPGVVLIVVSLASGATVIGCSGGSSTSPSPSTSTPTPTPTTPSPTPGGFTATSADGNASVSVPANDGVTSGQVMVTSSTSAPASTGLVPNTAYDLAPSGTAFTTPVTLTTKFSPGALPTGAVASQLAMFTVSNGAWTAVPGSTVNMAANTVTASLSHFSTYAILAPNSFAGTFNGRYSGGANGNFQMVIFPTGAIQLSGVDAIAGTFNGTGTLTLSGAASVMAQGSGGVANGASFTFVGTFQNSGGSVTATGTWSSQFQGRSGGGGNWSIP
jgi:hypothetical protein